MAKTTRFLPFLLLILLASGMVPGRGQAADVIIVGNTRLKLVEDAISGIRKSLKASIVILSVDEARGNLRRMVETDPPLAVIALGRDALEEAKNLPADIPVIYSFVITPPVITKPNTTGIYMAVPVREYLMLIKTYLHSIKKIAVIGSSDQLKLLDEIDPSFCDAYSVKDPVDLVESMKQLNHANAILLLPNVSLLTPTAMEETYLQSFRKGIPLLGVSEGQVRDGALFSLVVDLDDLGKSVGEVASAVTHGTGIDGLPPAPAKKFNLYLNTETAKKMGIRIPEKMLEMAKEVYP